MRQQKVVYRVMHGAIVDQFDAVLYDSESIKDLTLLARLRLAQLHTEHENDANFDWEHAEAILIEEGLLLDPLPKGADSAVAEVR